MNAELYDSLPADIQQILKDVSWEAAHILQVSTVAEFVILENMLTLGGIEIVHLEPAEEAKAVELLKPLEDEWLAIAGPYGPELLAAIKAEIAKFRAFEAYPK